MLLKSLFFLAVASATAAGAAAEPRAPTGKWVVNFAASQCIAHRDYGTPGNSLLLLFKAPPVGDVIQLAVLRQASPAAADQVDSIVTIDDRRPLETDLLMYSPKGSKERIYALIMPSGEVAALRQARRLSVRSKGLNETFALSQMEPLLKTVEKCVLNLRRVWNVDPSGAEPAGLRSRATADLAKLFSSKDYPPIAVFNSQSGRVRFVLLVGENGRVADCTIVETSGVPALDSQACALLKTRARFVPARGIDGKPAKDSVVGSVVWRI